MKKYITEDQFLSLPFEKSLELLNIMGYPQEDVSEEFYYDNKPTIARRFAFIIEKIDIGAMLEIIADNSKYISPICYPKNSKGWCVDITYKTGEEDKVAGEELCDCLWDILKKIL